MNKSGKHILTNRFKCLVYLLANNKWSGHFTLSVYKKVFIRQSSMGLLCFCMSYKQMYWLSLFWNIFQ